MCSSCSLRSAHLQDEAPALLCGHCAPPGGVPAGQAGREDGEVPARQRSRLSTLSSTLHSSWMCTGSCTLVQRQCRPGVLGAGPACTVRRSAAAVHQLPPVQPARRLAPASACTRPASRRQLRAVAGRHQSTGLEMPILSSLDLTAAATCGAMVHTRTCLCCSVWTHARSFRQLLHSRGRGSTAPHNVRVAAMPGRWCPCT